MPQVGFEPTIPVLEQSKTIHTLDQVAIGPGQGIYNFSKFF